MENKNVVSDERELVKIPSITLHHDPVLNRIKKFENHPSILEIKTSSV